MRVVVEGDTLGSDEEETKEMRRLTSTMTWREGFEDAGVGADTGAGAGAGAGELSDPTLSTTTWGLPSPAITDSSEN